MDKNETVNCIVCNKELINQSTDFKTMQPHNGLEFFTYGHYGSTVFDPVTVRKRICVAICDECVQQGVKYGNVIGDIDEVSLEPYIVPQSDPKNGIF